MVEPSVKAALGQQAGLGALLDHPTVVQHHQQPLEGVLYQPLAPGVGVQAGGGLAQHEDGRAPELRPGDGDPLALSPGKLDLPLANDSVGGRRLALDQIMGVCGTYRPLDVSLRGLWARIGGVLAHRAAEEGRLLRNHPDGRQDLCEPETAEVHAVEPGRPR